MDLTQPPVLDIMVLIKWQCLSCSSIKALMISTTNESDDQHVHTVENFISDIQVDCNDEKCLINLLLMKVVSISHTCVGCWNFHSPSLHSNWSLTQGYPPISQNQCHFYCCWWVGLGPHRCWLLYLLSASSINLENKLSKGNIADRQLYHSFIVSDSATIAIPLYSLCSPPSNDYHFTLLPCIIQS